MAGIAAPLRDILQRLSTLDVVNADSNTVKLFARIFNDQIKNEQQGESQFIPKPAAFVEVVNNAVYQEIGQGYSSCDIVFRIHLVHEYYNMDGTFEQDLKIFDLRDSVITLLNHYKPTGCGLLVRMTEAQQYDHANVYEYIIEFGCNFTDSTGSIDDTQGLIDKLPPTGINLTAEIIPEVAVSTDFNIQQYRNYNIPQ